jgi:hypothetical protein
VIPEIQPLQASLRIVLLVQGLEDLNRFFIRQNSLSFVRGSVHLFNRPDQSQSSLPEAIQNFLGFIRVIQDGGELANHLNDVMVVHRCES